MEYKVFRTNITNLDDAVISLSGGSDKITIFDNRGFTFCIIERPFIKINTLGIHLAGFREGTNSEPLFVDANFQTK